MRMPSIFAPGTASSTLLKIFLYAARASSAPWTFRITPPASYLWTTSADITFITTGLPNDSAIRAASSAFWATALFNSGRR